MTATGIARFGNHPATISDLIFSHVFNDLAILLFGFGQIHVSCYKQRSYEIILVNCGLGGLKVD
jgi:hypothetical protein